MDFSLDAADGYACHGYELKHHPIDCVVIEKHPIPAVPNNRSEIIEKMLWLYCC